MSAGLGRLGLTPQAFWAMTPRELDAALRGHYGLDQAAPQFSRLALDHLIAAFPDRDSAPAHADPQP
jgi:uncharacterized phage protein (TIGR02216 family)